MINLAGSLPLYPARTSSAWYLGLMAAGALLLALPWSHASGHVVSPLDALFTATSAVCVTGLGVVSTPDDFNLLGQFVILVLIQIGGVGIMTLTTFFVFQIRAGASLRDQAVVGETLGVRGFTDLRWVLREVLIGTLIWELLGTLALLPVFLNKYGLGQALWYSAFHSISAFCNAGFSLQNDSLVGFADSPWCNLVIAVLIVSGGLGFPVHRDLYHFISNRWSGKAASLQMHTKITLLGYAIFFSLGWAATVSFEWNGAFAHLRPMERLVAGAFHSVSCRTAGFNTVDLTAMRPATLVVSMVLMMIGAGACSTGGGVKVSTVMVLLGHAWARLRGLKRLNLFRRTVPTMLMERALASTMVFWVVAGSCLIALLAIQTPEAVEQEHADLFLIMGFEVVSALGTVGLSIGGTAKLTAVGKLLVVLLMFLGRVGPIAVFSSVSLVSRRSQVEYASEEPLLG
ncbi:MAG: hypothetical protein KDA83_05060 [Planctomycetales bacterium]|nr:hypothetical protein [Planctomycetales bacterium]